MSDLLLDDPMFDFALMIAPMGPPAVTIAAVSIYLKNDRFHFLIL